MKFVSWFYYNDIYTSCHLVALKYKAKFNPRRFNILAKNTLVSSILHESNESVFLIVVFYKNLVHPMSFQNEELDMSSPPHLLHK